MSLSEHFPLSDLFITLIVRITEAYMTHLHKIWDSEAQCGMIVTNTYTVTVFRRIVPYGALIFYSSETWGTIQAWGIITSQA